nr:sulfur carrier protein ThiS [uncultured Agathobaculum sp.]
MKINGEACACSPGLTVLLLLEQRGHDPQRVAVEKNGQIVPRARFAEEPLHEDDAIEIVQFVGGG